MLRNIKRRMAVVVVGLFMVTMMLANTAEAADIARGVVGVTCGKCGANLTNPKCTY